MGMTEKQALIDTLTIKLVEDFNINLKEIKAKITEVLQSYHITISDNAIENNDLSTEFLMKKFEEGKAASGMKLNTIKQYQIAVLKLEDTVNKKLSDIEPEDITKFLRIYGKTVSDVTLKTKFQLLSSVYNFLFQHRYISYNPISYVDTPKATVIYKTPMTELDLEKLKKTVEVMPEKESLRDNAILNFFLSTGCRVSELCNVKIADVDLDSKICKVQGKGKKERPVVLTDKCCYRLKLYLDTRKDVSSNAPLFAHIRGDEEPITKDGVGHILKRIRKNAGVDNITCHTFRRFYATELRRRGVNIQIIASSLGHANLNQINRYSLYNSSEMLQTVRNAM